MMASLHVRGHGTAAVPTSTAHAAGVWALRALAVMAAMTAALVVGAGLARADTSAVGSYTTTFGISVPAFHGIEPKVALDYGSARGNGEVGVGWRLDVGSRITRRGSLGGLPRYDGSDRFLLDGAELVVCAPHCQTGGTHEARQQSFERIVFDGTTWTRWLRSGVRMTYETAEDPKAGAYQWSLARVVDTHGNTVTYEDDCLAGHCYPSKITYAASTVSCGDAGQPVCKAGALVQFDYEDRKDVIEYSTGTGTRQIRRRLKTVEVHMDGHLVRAYALTYEPPSPSTGNSILHSVQQFPSDATIATDGSSAVRAEVTPPLPPTVFTWESIAGAAGAWSLRSQPAQSSITNPPGNRYFPVVSTSVPGNTFGQPDAEDVSQSPAYGDFDGDGRADLAGWTRTGACNTIYVRLADQPEGPPRSTPFQRCPPYAFTADLNGDGFDDLLMMNRFGNLKSAVSNRDGTFTVAPAYASTPWVGLERRCATGDIDGDDLADLVCVYDSNGALRVGVVRSVPGGGFMTWNAPLPSGIASVSSVLITTGDVDSNGTSDVMLAVAAEGTTFTLFTGYGSPSGTVAFLGAPQPTTWNRGEPSADWRLSSGDVTGDARADFVLIADTSSVYLAISEKPQTGTVTHFEVKPSVPTGAKNVAVGDSDGDGRDDVLTGAPAGVLYSNGDGSFQQEVPLSTQAGQSCAVEDDAETAAGDINGDGQADLLCSSLDLSSSGPPQLTYWAQPSPVSANSLTRRIPADVNGDGRQDLVYLLFRNPGYEVYTFLGQADGSYASSHRPVTPRAALLLDHPNAAGWIPMDVGGPQGAADGRTDLVLINRESRTFQVTTLLSTETGWALQPADKPWRPTGPDPPYGTADVQAWRPADLNHDGRTDLVHFWPLGTGVRMEYLLANGDGTWTSGSSKHFDSTVPSFDSTVPSAGPLTRTDVNTFRSTDLNGDGITDFIHVETGGGPFSAYYTVRSLISTGVASWEDETWRRLQPMDSRAAHELQPMDFNGDGVPDLGRVRVVNGCAEITAYLREGLSWSDPQTSHAEQPCQPAVSVEDSQRFVFADINRDGRSDLYHLSQYLDANKRPKNAIYTLINPGPGPGSDPWPAWRAPPQPELATAFPDTWAFIGLDANHDGKTDLAHVGVSDVATLHWTGSDDRLVGINNGRGAITTIAYRAQAEARSYLPEGMLPTVVASLTIRDTAHDPAVQATTTWTYDGARWSNRYRQLIGYATVRSREADAVAVTGYNLGDACGARPSSTSTQTASGGVFHSSRHEFVPAGDAAPFTCLPMATVAAECELTSACQERRTSYAYDEFGNLETMEESSDAGRRRVFTPVHPNLTDYIVDRPYKREVLVPGRCRPPRCSLQSRTLFGYDDDTWEHGPHQHGDLTRVTEFSDIAHDKASETFHLYDGAGNRYWTLNPVGVVTTVGYDTDRNLFPVSTCDPVGCTETVWDEILGVVRSTTDVNQQTTTTDHDAYGRPTTTTRPNHSSTTTRYLATGTVTGPDAQRQRVRTEVTDDSPGDRIHWHEDLIDGLGRTYRTLDEGTTTSPGATIISDTRYADASNRPAAVSDPHTSSEQLRWTNYTYDAARRPKATTHPGKTGATSRQYRVGAVDDRDEAGHLTSTYHDAFGRVVRVEQTSTGCQDGSHSHTVRPGDSLWSIAAACRPHLDKASLLVAVRIIFTANEGITDGHGHTLHHPNLIYPGMLLDLRGPIPQATVYGYDASDRLISIVDAAQNTTTIVRDDLGRQTSITDPDRGARTQTWRADGTIETQTDANGFKNWTYDPAGRPLTRTETNASGQQEVRWNWDHDPTSKKTQGGSIGHPTLVTYSASGLGGAMSGSHRSWYDELGRTTRDQRCVGTACQEMGYAFDPAGRLLYLRYPKPGDPDGEQVKYAYDPAGRLTSVGTYLTNIKHNSLGQTTEQTYGNGLTERFSYDPNRHWLNNHTFGEPPKPKAYPPYAATYTHDRTARITNLVTWNPTGPGPQPVTQNFTYDNLGRLASVTNSDRPSLLPEWYEYDAIGRIRSSPTAGSYHYDDAAHLHAPTSTNQGHTREYDAAGNLKHLSDPQGRSLDITWTPDGMPRTTTDSASGATTFFGYDPNGQRVKKESPSEFTDYFGRYLEQADGNALTRYYWAGNQLIARRGPTGDVAYYLQDHVHSTRMVTDGQANITARYNYEPYGSEKTGNQADGTRQLWHGQRTDDDSGLVYMNARYYDPKLDQFISPDRVIPNMHRPQSLNRYSFVENDGGLNFTDPSGNAKMEVERRKEQAWESRRAFPGARPQCPFSWCPREDPPEPGLFTSLSDYERSFLRGDLDPPAPGINLDAARLAESGRFRLDETATGPATSGGPHLLDETETLSLTPAGPVSLTPSDAAVPYDEYTLEAGLTPTETGSGLSIVGLEPSTGVQIGDLRIGVVQPAVTNFVDRSVLRSAGPELSGSRQLGVTVGPLFGRALGLSYGNPSASFTFGVSQSSGTRYFEGGSGGSAQTDPVPWYQGVMRLRF